MTSADISRIRLSNQQLTTPNYKTAKQVVAHMGAMQAQDYAMAKWAVGMRTKGATEKTINAAIDKGQILRTHVLRPTWHFISSEDIYWMLELTGPRIKMAMKSRNKELGLSDAVFKKSNRIISKALEKGEHLGREELLNELKHAKIPTDENRASHLLMYAELDGISCSGSTKKTRSYALLESQVPKKNTLKKDEALAKLANIYFKSHGPATLADFTWWSGLSATDAKLALAFLSSDFRQEMLGLQTYWWDDAHISKAIHSHVILLPAFDEYLISYKDRTAAVQLEHQKKAFSNNGIFWPTVIVNGRAIGIWKRTVKKDKVLIETDYFHPHNTTLKTLLKKSADSFGHFLGLKANIGFAKPEV